METPKTPNGGICDCGHLPTPQKPGACGTGYAVNAAGKTYCYACCAERDKADMIATGRATLYLTKRLPTDAREPYAFWHYVTNGPGSLEFRCIRGAYEGATRSSRGGGFGAQRTDAWFVGPDGYVWHAVNRGDNDIARCRRTKGRVK